MIERPEMNKRVNKLEWTMIKQLEMNMLMDD